MANQRFIPELHDIGKLVDDKLKDRIGLRGSRGRKHTFDTFDFQKFRIQQPTSPSWWGQYHHICYDNNNQNWIECDRKKIRTGLHTSISEIDINNWNIIPQNLRFNLFLLILADHFASSVSRATLELGRVQASQDGILKLWNKEFYQNEVKKGKHWAAFKTFNDLRTLFGEIQNCQSGGEFLNSYREHLLLTPEDKSIPRNVTTFYTHVELVGKIYRVLEKTQSWLQNPMVQ